MNELRTGLHGSPPMIIRLARTASLQDPIFSETRWIRSFPIAGTISIRQLPILESPDNGSPRCDAHYAIPCFAGSKPVSHISYALDDVDLVQATGSNESTVFQHSEVIDFASSKPVTLIAK